MANPKHVALVKAGKAALDEWLADPNRPDEQKRLDLSNAIFNDADLCGFDFANADLSNGSFTNARLSEANLSNADLRGTTLQYATLDNTTLTDANLEGVNLTSAKCVGTDFTTANLRKVNFTNATLHGCMFLEANLTSSMFQEVEFKNCQFKSAALQRANFVKARFNGPEESHFDHCDLTHTGWHDADLERTQFSDVVLRHSSWIRTQLRSVSFTRADLWEANFDGTVCRNIALTSVKNLETIKRAESVIYFDTARRKFVEKYCDWEQIRRFGNMKLFAISYSMVLFLISAFFVIGIYNQKIEATRAWAEKVQEDDSLPTRELAGQITERINVVSVGISTIILLVSTLILTLASGIYSFYCPEEVKEFTRVQWCHQLGRGLPHYWAFAWKHPFLRVACGLLYLTGGLTFLVISLWKIGWAVASVWQYVGI